MTASGAKVKATNESVYAKGLKCPQIGADINKLRKVTKLIIVKFQSVWYK